MDSALFVELCTAQRQGLLAYAFACSGDLHAAEDIVQETLAIAVAKREADVQDPQAWLFGIARNMWFRERDRRCLAERTSAFVHEHAGELFAVEPGDEATGLDAERCALRQCLLRLGEIDRQLVMDHFAGGHRYDAIATRLGRTLSWVKVRMFRVRAALLECVRHRLARETDAA